MYGATISYKQTEFVERSKNLVYNRNFSNAIHMCVYIYMYIQYTFTLIYFIYYYLLYYFILLLYEYIHIYIYLKFVSK